MTGEISFDLVAAVDNEFEEGAYRLPDGEWRVFVFSKRPVAAPEVRPTAWDCGATGVWVAFPAGEALNRETVKRLLGAALGVEGWVEVRGPDSMALR